MKFSSQRCNNIPIKMQLSLALVLYRLSTYVSFNFSLQTKCIMMNFQYFRFLFRKCFNRSKCAMNGSTNAQVYWFHSWIQCTKMWNFRRKICVVISFLSHLKFGHDSSEILFLTQGPGLSQPFILLRSGSFNPRCMLRGVALPVLLISHIPMSLCLVHSFSWTVFQTFYILFCVA